MKIKSIAVLPDARGYLAVSTDDLFEPEYIVLAVVENENVQGIASLAIADLLALNDLIKSPSEFELKFNGKAIRNSAVSSTIIKNVTLHTAAAYIGKEATYSQDVEEAKENLINMARRAGVRYDKRIDEITSIEDCQKIVSQTFKKL